MVAQNQGDKFSEFAEILSGFSQDLHPANCASPDHGHLKLGKQSGRLCCKPAIQRNVYKLEEIPMIALIATAVLATALILIGIRKSNRPQPVKIPMKVEARRQSPRR